MMGRFANAVRKNHANIICEAEQGEKIVRAAREEDGKKFEAEVIKGFHGIIIIREKDKDDIILGKTDPTYPTAKKAIDAMKETVAAEGENMKVEEVITPDNIGKVSEVLDDEEGGDE